MRAKKIRRIWVFFLYLLVAAPLVALPLQAKLIAQNSLSKEYVRNSLPKDYDERIIEKLILDGCTVKEVDCSGLENSIKKILAKEKFNLALSEKIKKLIHSRYRKAGYPYVFVDNFFLHDIKNPQPNSLTIFLRENPVVKIEVHGSRKKKDIIRFLRIKLNKPYNERAMKKQAELLFASEFFHRHFKVLRITPYFLKKNGIYLGLDIQEKKTDKYTVSLADSSQRARLKASVFDPAAYGSKNQAEIYSAITAADTIGPWQVGLKLNDYYDDNERNVIRYFYQLDFQDHRKNSNGYLSAKMSMQYSYSFNMPNKIPLFFTFFGYDFSYRDQDSRNVNMHSFFTRLYYNDLSFLIEDRFNNEYEIKLGWLFSQSKFADSLDQPLYIKGKLKQWLNLYDDWWLNVEFNYYRSHDMRRLFQETIQDAIWSLQSSSFSRAAIAAYYDLTYYMPGLFFEAIDRQGGAVGMTNRIFWLGFRAEIRLGAAQSLAGTKQFFIHGAVNARF